MRSTDRVALPPFQALVDAHWRDVARLAAALAGPADGDDVAQQAWLRAFAAYPTLRSARNLKSWLLTITARCAIDSHRRRREIPAGRIADRPAGERPEPDPRLWLAVRRLPERQRLAIGLRYVADLSHAAIARSLGTTPAASRRLVADALARLRTQLPEGGSDD